MNTVVGREKEIKILNDALQSKRPELIAVYGRRRVGKTFLINEVYKNHIKFEITGLYKSPLPEQINHFTNRIRAKAKRFDSKETPKSWMNAFLLLEQYLDGLKSKKKKVVFIDEFPWLATPRSRFLMAFGNFWNSYASKRNDLVVVICGSSASYMIQNIILSKGGLHNRITESIRLQPFSLYETELFLKRRKFHFSRYDILHLYMILGGVPHYLDHLEQGFSVSQNIDKLCFSKDGFLVSEFNKVFQSLFTNSEKHELIVKTLSKSSKGLTRDRLLQKCKLPSSGDFTKILQELIESGFVSQYLPFGKKTKLSLYRLSDEYSIFYLKFIHESKAKSSGAWQHQMNGRSYTSWSGFAFETLCLKHVEQIRYALGVGAVYSEHSSWHNENAQVDLVIDRSDNVINLCEIKFTKAPFTITKKYASELINKTNEFMKSHNYRKSLFTTMITVHGLVQNQHSLQVVTNSISADSLFEF